MKIAFILSPSCLTSNIYSGVVVQARQWARGLYELGHQVEFPQAQMPISWDKYDIVHMFQFGAWTAEAPQALRAKARKLILSPIIDPPVPYGLRATLVSRIPFEYFRLVQRQRLLHVLGHSCDTMLARSEHEAKSLRALGINKNKIKIAAIPISKNWQFDDKFVRCSPRNGSIFHVSHLSQPRKNVRTLVEIAIKEQMSLRLAGSISDPQFRSWLEDITQKNKNIVYLGRISDEQMQEEMLSCSVFCLPSLFEGVGLVALDAAMCGANLVVTDRGGTPEYFGPTTHIVNPLNIPALTAALNEALTRTSPDMIARHHVLERFTHIESARRLASLYQEL